MRRYIALLSSFGLLLMQAACLSEDPRGLAVARPAVTTVKLDLFSKPFPEIPLPIDLATRHDPSSATSRRLNVPLNASTRFEAEMRRRMNQLDGWGVFQFITIPFSGPIDVGSVLAAHRDQNYGLADDVVYLIDVDPASPALGQVYPLDLGNGNYPFVLKRRDDYWPNDPREHTMSLLLEETDEDQNGNGVLDPGEDTDADGRLDRPNYLPGKNPSPSDPPATRADALMTFYEKETHTLILRPMMPLRERTTYAVVVTRRLLDEAGRPVGSPFDFINHAAQTDALRLLPALLPEGNTVDDIAFAFSFTTQSIESHFRAVREGLYGHGVQAHLGRDFPPELAGLEKLRDSQILPRVKNPYLLHPEEAIEALKPLIVRFMGVADGSATMETFIESQKYVDFHVIGSFSSPQLFRRTRTDLSTAADQITVGEEGGSCRPDGACEGPLRCLLGRCVQILPLNEQSWPPDLDRRPAEAQREQVHFWLSVPRREVSVRGEGRPAPVVVHSHGTGNSKIENIVFSGFFAKYGMATITIDGPSQGLPMSALDESLAKTLVEGSGLAPFIEAVLKGRAYDQNNDGRKDSAGDLWTAYVFHTRDMVRQAVLDGMQLVRILRSFDGQRRGKLDVNLDGTPELAGDFDGDGKVDAGGDVPLYLTGISQGGIVTLLEGSIEPEFRAIAPISGGAGLADVALRTRELGVPEAFALRLMGPLFLGALDQSSGAMTLETLVPDINRSFATKSLKALTFATISGVAAGDTVVVENQANGERGCATISADGRFRASVASDLGDPIRLLFYAGGVLAGPSCRLQPDAAARLEVSTFQQDLSFQGEVHREGTKLVALAEGLGLRRATPDLRRFITLGQVGIDPGDPVGYLRFLQTEPLHYPALKQKTGAHALIVTTVGDPSVPSNTGVTAGRAAGLIDFLQDDPRYGKPVNQVLVDTYVCEGVSNLGRFQSTADLTQQGVALDVEDFSRGTDMWGSEEPRLDPPLRIGWKKKDPLGGASAAIFPLADINGSHYFGFPGQMVDRARAFCRSRCSQTGGDDPCGCKTLASFDVGLYLYNILGRYFASGGTVLDDDLCNSRDDCPDRRPPPQLRDVATLD